MLRELRVIAAPELNASHRSVEARAPALRISAHFGQNVASDYALLERAAPFVDRMSRSCVTIVLDGIGRFDESGKRAWLDAGSVLVSDQRRGGIEAYAGPSTSLVVLEWDPKVVGTEVAGAFRTTTLGSRDRERLRAIAPRLATDDAAHATVTILDILRSMGLPFARLVEADLVDRTTDADRRLTTAVGDRLSQLETSPSIEEVSEDSGFSSRHANRRFSALARAYGLPLQHWRAVLHQTRLLAAFRFLSAPNATTELVARRTGFRSPTALCHAFAKSGLPSPGVLARAARRDVLDAWTAYGPSDTSQLRSLDPGEKRS